MTLKKTIQSYWTRNVPYLEIVSGKNSPETKEFYQEVDAFRYKYDSYIPGLIRTFASGGKTVLEIGSGMGSDSRYIASLGAKITSLDLSPENVSFTLKGVHLSGLKGEGVCGDGEKLPFRNNTFDVVYSFGVLHHTPNTENAIAEVYRVLKPKGQCVIMLYHKGYAYYVLLFLYGWRRIFLKETKEQLMSKYDHTPLSKLYSKNDAGKIFSFFKNVNFEVEAYGGAKAHPILKHVWFILNKSKFLMNHFGSFLIIRGTK